MSRFLATAMASGSGSVPTVGAAEVAILEDMFRNMDQTPPPEFTPAPTTPEDEPPLNPQQPDSKRRGTELPWRVPPLWPTPPPGPPVDPRGSSGATLEKSKPPKAGKPLGVVIGDVPTVGEPPAVGKPPAVAVGNVLKPTPPTSPPPGRRPLAPHLKWIALQRLAKLQQLAKLHQRNAAQPSLA